MESHHSIPLNHSAPLYFVKAGDESTKHNQHLPSLLTDVVYQALLLSADSNLLSLLLKPSLILYSHFFCKKILLPLHHLLIMKISNWRIIESKMPILANP